MTKVSESENCNFINTLYDSCHITSKRAILQNEDGEDDIVLSRRATIREDVIIALTKMIEKTSLFRILSLILNI
jgi:hypothetical protein